MMKRPGDIVLFKVKAKHLWKCPLSVAIGAFQKSRCTHAAMLISPGKDEIVEAWWPFCRINTTDYDLYEICVVRPKGILEGQSFTAASVARKMNGMKCAYDEPALIGLAKFYLVERFLGVPVRKKFYNSDSPDKYFCSELVAVCYMLAGFSLADLLGFTDYSQITPADFDRQIDKFDVIEKSEGW
jgi:hypothetical protein